MSVDKVARSEPIFDSAVSWLWREVSCALYGFSAERRLVTILSTVADTSKPSPLVGDPKLSPTAVIVVSSGHDGRPPPGSLHPGLRGDPGSGEKALMRYISKGNAPVRARSPFAG